jgi:hypothetical protein
VLPESLVRGGLRREEEGKGGKRREEEGRGGKMRQLGLLYLFKE